MCRELTKTYEEVVRGPLDELVEWARGEVRGEITVVVEGAPAVAVRAEDAVALVLERVAAGERLKDACTAVAAQTGAAKKALYDEALRARHTDR